MSHGLAQHYAEYDVLLSTSLPDELRLAPHAPSPGWHAL